MIELTGPIAICILSPHLGILDAWLPLLWQLKRTRPELSLLAIFPRRNDAIEVTDKDFLVEYSKELFEGVICMGEGGQGTAYSSIVDAAAPMTNAAGGHSGLSIGNTVKLESLRERVKLVCFDLATRMKVPVKEILDTFSSARSFSVPHGIDLRMWGGHPTGQPSLRSTAYLLSTHEVEFYRTKYGLGEEDIRVVGVLRHDPRWIDEIKRYYEAEHKPSGSYIFLASRPSNNLELFPPSRKRNAVEAVGQLASELGCKIVVRRHPKEREEAIFEDVLGVAQYGKAWEYSALHPFVLGESALFCVTFFSSIAVDMAALGTPVIELCDFRGLSGGKQLFRNGEGQPISIYQKFGLALGARDYEELKLRADDVLTDRTAVAKRLRAAVRAIYSEREDRLSFVVSDIEKFALREKVSSTPR